MTPAQRKRRDEFARAALAALHVKIVDVVHFGPTLIAAVAVDLADALIAAAEGAPSTKAELEEQWAALKGEAPGKSEKGTKQ